jgi:hypothetical protein
MFAFSFQENPIIHVLRKQHSLLPGITKVIALYYCNESDEIKTKSVINCKDNGNIIENVEFEADVAALDKLRISNSYFKWMKKEELPFFKKDELQIGKKSKKQTTQMDVFHELDNVVLSLGFINEFDKKNDLLFFYFNYDLSNFGVADSTKVLTIENKKIIGFILYNSVKTIIDTANKDLLEYNDYNENTKSIIKRFTQSRDERDKSKSNYGYSLIDLCKSYVKECSKGSRFTYILSDDALNRIKLYQGDITALKIIIQKAINYVNNLYFDSNKAEIYISEDYLNFESTGAGIATKPQEVQLYDRYSKTIILLDKLHDAARVVMTKNMDLISANVGNAFATPISAPAISDALKKHRNKIITLMNKYPERWDLLRRDFRPIRNILSSQPGPIEKTA